MNRRLPDFTAQEHTSAKGVRTKRCQHQGGPLWQELGNYGAPGEVGNLSEEGGGGRRVSKR